MANIFNLLFGRRKKPEPPKVPDVPGHRGIGLGLGNKPDTQTVPGRTVNRQMITADEVQRFVYGGEPLFVYSSNVGLLQYFPEDQKLMVEYLPKNGRPASAYLYSNVTAEEATEIAHAQSKGSILWDLLRVRGTRNQHRKPYVRLR